MTLPLAIAEKLVMLAAGAKVPASNMRHKLIDEMLAEGIIAQIAKGTRRMLYVENPASMEAWLHNRCGINNLQQYLLTLLREDISRQELVQVASDSKARRTRSFEGFMVNSYLPINCMLVGQPFVVQPVQGTFTFINNYRSFVPAPQVVVVGIENAENFCHVQRTAHLFAGMEPLFVCRYPQDQHADLRQWLMGIPNRYLHFGDHDPAGINIYLSEYKKHLGDRASYLIPPNIEPILAQYGSHTLYDRQQLHNTPITEPALVALIALLHKHKKGLEQEIWLVETS